ncbi:hypothetical protein C0J52_18640 [Blattella germanica]|nr:hypothetical protein C0J52_18640 [Blattella germanica]
MVNCCSISVILCNCCKSFHQLSEYCLLWSMFITHICKALFNLLAPLHNCWMRQCTGTIHRHNFKVNLSAFQMFCPQESYCSSYFKFGVCFHLTHHFTLSLLCTS